MSDEVHKLLSRIAMLVGGMQGGIDAVKLHPTDSVSDFTAALDGALDRGTEIGEVLKQLIQVLTDEEETRLTNSMV